MTKTVVAVTMPLAAIAMVILFLSGRFYQQTLHAQTVLNAGRQEGSRLETSIDPGSQIKESMVVLEWYSCIVPDGCVGLHQMRFRLPDGTTSQPYIVLLPLDGHDYVAEEPTHWQKNNVGRQ